MVRMLTKITNRSNCILKNIKYCLGSKCSSSFSFPPGTMVACLFSTWSHTDQITFIQKIVNSIQGLICLVTSFDLKDWPSAHSGFFRSCWIWYAIRKANSVYLLSKWEPDSYNDWFCPKKHFRVFQDNMLLCRPTNVVLFQMLKNDVLLVVNLSRVCVGAATRGEVERFPHYLLRWFEMNT